MTLSEFKNGLPSCFANAEYDGTIDLLNEWNGCDINNDTVDEYNCSLGDVANTLDSLGISYSLVSGLYLHINIIFQCGAEQC